MLKNTNTTYGWPSILLHWLVGIAILAMLIVGFIMSDMPKSDEKFAIYGIHKATGVIVLFLVALRLAWKSMNASVALPQDLPNWQKYAAKTTYFLLYSLMFAMPISGILMSYFGGHEINVYNIFTISPIEIHNKYLSKIFRNIHEISAICLSGLVMIHILAALYHHFIRKDNILLKILGLNAKK